METNEIKIVEYNDGKCNYYRVLVYDNKRRLWHEITSDFGSIAMMIMYAQKVFNDINGGVEIAKKQSR